MDDYYKSLCFCYSFKTWCEKLRKIVFSKHEMKQHILSFVENNK